MKKTKKNVRQNVSWGQGNKSTGKETGSTHEKRVQVLNPFVSMNLLFLNYQAVANSMGRPVKNTPQSLYVFKGCCIQRPF